ncbi:12534_t:CDS:2 [Cetraspora pellucida]|uniref:12534_t:CDS:1 n=1 Tax=Cetraspora pellucida TaxID=1433469 RepID=A0A9N9IYA7_9GLOM|nr:12534_t:CDS:2 [Cetraspora pellucida]
MKTGILPLVSNEDVELAQNTCLESIEHEEKETLNDTQIVETILAEQLEYEQGDPDDSDKKPPKITAAEGISGLKSFILFAKQQICDDFFFNNNYLKVFCKYLSLMKQKITESMNQKPITDFFKTADQSMSINDNFFNETGFFDDDNVFPNNENFFGSNNFSDDNDFSGDNFSGDNDFFDDNNLSYYYGFSDNYNSSNDY